MKFHFASVKVPGSVASQDWQNWSWQLRKSLKTQADFAEMFQLSHEELLAFKSGEEVFNIRTTPYYAALCGSSQEGPLRKILMPTVKELLQGAQAQFDPLAERKNNPVGRVIHRYPDRVLFLVTDICSVYCRFCTRKHFTGQEQAFIQESEYLAALKYIREHRGIREVILSGGDPLTLSDQQLARVLADLRNIEHLEIIRIGTRMPVVCPMRITTGLLEVLKPHRPIYLMSHFNHPKELTLEAKQAIDLIVDAGIPVMNQMVLLNGVNNHPAIVQALSRRLLYLRIKPYYMFQCDPSEGTDHLRTSIEESEEIQKALWGHLSGLALPQLSLDIPSGGGKVALVPNFEISRRVDHRGYRGFDGVAEEYVNPPAEQKKLPLDYAEYLPEWEALKNAKNISIPFQAEQTL